MKINNLKEKIKIKENNNDLYETYNFLGNKIIESCKIENIKDFDYKKTDKTIYFLYKNENIKIKINNGLIVNKKDLDNLKENFLKFSDYKKGNFEKIILFDLIIGLIFFPKITAVIMVSVFISWILGIGFVLSIVGTFVFLTELLFYYLFVLFTKIVSFFIVRGNYFLLDLINFLGNKLNINFMKDFYQFLLKNLTEDLKIDFSYTFLNPLFLNNLDNLKILDKDNNSIRLKGKIENKTKYLVGKEILRTALILGKFYKIYLEIDNLVKNWINDVEKQSQIKIQEINNIKDQKIIELKKQYEKFLETNKELEYILSTLRKLFGQPVNLEIFDELDNLLTKLQDYTKKIEINNKKIEINSRKLKKISYIKKSIQKEINKIKNKIILDIYQKDFKHLLLKFSKINPLITNKALEINKKIENLINKLNKKNNEIFDKIIKEEDNLKQETKELLSETEKISNEIIEIQNKIKKMQKELKENLDK